LDEDARQLEPTERYLRKRVKNVLCEHFTVLEDKINGKLKESGKSAAPVAESRSTELLEVENLLRSSEASLTELDSNLNALADQVDRYGISQLSDRSSWTASTLSTAVHQQRREIDALDRDLSQVTRLSRRRPAITEPRMSESPPASPTRSNAQDDAIRENQELLEKCRGDWFDRMFEMSRVTRDLTARLDSCSSAVEGVQRNLAAAKLRLSRTERIQSQINERIVSVRRFLEEHQEHAPGLNHQELVDLENNVKTKFQSLSDDFRQAENDMGQLWTRVRSTFHR
jgi:chromosome segregation ATPase